MALQAMGILFFFFYFLFFLGETGDLISVRAALSRSVFPKNFIFGAASSSYQYEGGAFEDGKGPSVWDTFTHEHPERIDDRSNGDVAIDSYHRYKEDIDLLKNMHMDAYRFSISWPRILPNGSLSGGINKKGVQYYNNLINYLIANGMKPFVTLFHWDTPQAVEDAYGGFLSQKIVNDFRDYAEVCFKEFGDRVKHWITFNEPFSYCSFGYGTGTFAPGRCSPWVSENCKAGDSGREPYIAGQNMLLAHGATVKLYREKYKASQEGSIGITIVSNWYIPLSKSKVNAAAVTRALDFMYGWFMNPLTYGEYPSTMRSLVGDRLPNFTKEQSLLLKGSYDFLGLNYYTTYYVSSKLTMNKHNASFFTDSNTNATAFRNGKPIGPVAASPWLFLYAPGIRELLLYTKEKYKNPAIYITENGVSEANNSTLTLKEALQDGMRITYYRQHLLYLQRAIRGGVDVRGYFAWSLLDNFEWVNGYTVRFGLNYVDYKDGLKRYPKKSALWLGKLLKP